MDVQAIGSFLLKLRKENNLTQKDIAKLCNVSAQAVSKWERGESVPDVELLERLSILYRISINEILNGEKMELYLDVEKRRNIIQLTAAVLVFLAYAFNFFRGEIDLLGISGISQSIKGFEMIFNGTGGFAVYLTWLVFLILISQLLINIFIITRVLIRKGLLNFYMILSSVGVLAISVVLFILPDFYTFPQLIIILCMIIGLVIGRNTDSSGSYDMFSKAKQYLRGGKMLLEDTPVVKKYVKWNKVATLTAILVYFGFTVILGAGIIKAGIRGQYLYYGLGRDIAAFVIAFIALVFMLMTFGSLRTKNSCITMIITGIITSVLPIMLLNIILYFPYSGNDFMDLFILILLFAIPIMMVFNIMRIWRYSFKKK